MKSILIAIFSFINLLVCYTQNPYKSLGINDVEVLTLSNGKYNEFFSNDTIVQIGSVLINTNSKKIISFVETDSALKNTGFEPQLVSRWIATDPLSEKYYEWSPYNYVMNNPIIFIDPDGQVVVDGNGNEVVVEQDEEGNYTGNYTFAENTSQEVQDQFIENGGALLNEMMTIETGTEYVTAAVESEEKIHYSISEDSPKSSDGSGNLKLAGTAPRVENGKEVGSNITIYKGSIDKAMQNGNVDSGLSLNQNMAARTVHETHHATNKDDLKVRRANGPGNLSKEQHQNAYNAGTMATFEFNELKSTLK